MGEGVTMKPKFIIVRSTGTVPGVYYEHEDAAQQALELIHESQRTGKEKDGGFLGRIIARHCANWTPPFQHSVPYYVVTLAKEETKNEWGDVSP